jgi:hypothetical protein
MPNIVKCFKTNDIFRKKTSKYLRQVQKKKSDLRLVIVVLKAKRLFVANFSDSNATPVTFTN